MMKSIRTIGTKECVVYADAEAQVLLVQAVGEHENDTLDAEIEAVCKAVSVPFVFAGFKISGWEKELMPWADSFVSKETEVGRHAGQTLSYLTDSLIPCWQSEYGGLSCLQSEYGGLPVIIGGYSLAGLFALWAATQTDLFASVGACSPSLWINNWAEYAESHPVHAKSVFLSLGDKEEKTRNRRLAAVGNCVRGEYDLLRRQLGEERCTLLWEQGGHFVTPHLRLARAYAWCINAQRE